MTTRGRTRAIALAATLAAVVLTSGCSGSGSGAATLSGSTTVTTSTPPPTTTSLSPAQQDAKDAGAAVVAFWAVIDRVGSDPKSKIEDLNTVARGDANAQWTKNLFDRRSRGERFIGATSVLVESSRFTGKAGSYRVAACLDVSKLNVVDAKGKSIVPAGREPHIGYVYGVTQDGGSSKWYVTTEQVSGKC